MGKVVEALSTRAKAMHVNNAAAQVNLQLFSILENTHPLDYFLDIAFRCLAFPALNFVAFLCAPNPCFAFLNIPAFSFNFSILSHSLSLSL
jgi:hypothetical protein